MSFPISYHHRKNQLNMLVLLMLILPIACVFITNLGQTTENAGHFPSTPDETPSSWHAVFFTDPGGPSSETLRGGPDKDLVNAIRGARVSVDIAALQANLWSLRDALIDAQRRGVTVRMVTDSDYIDQREIQDLIEAGIPVLGDRRQGLMHNKFVVLDRQEVWTGSMNFTVNDTYRNNNNLIRLRSSELAENYTTEFEEMFVDDHFGAGSPANTPHPILKIEGVRIENCFSPDDGCLAQLAELVKSSQKSIHFLAFSFTSDELAEAMLERSEAGVIVSGIFDKSQYYANIGTEFDRLRAAGLNVHLDNNPHSMHNKVIIIDDQIVITGSYNFTYFAENRNDENVLIVHSPEVAAIYLEEFYRLLDLSQ